MATPLSASRLVEALKEEGLTVHEVRDWRAHNRNHKGKWGPMNGVMIHHTATEGTDASVRVCYDGRPDLPGPLCHGVIDKKGEVWLVGNGRANHAGLGDGSVLSAVVAERAAPTDKRADTDGNSHFYGFECVNRGDGTDPWPEAQLLAIEKASAALCRAHGWSEKSVIGHLEWQPGKVDPRGFTMASMRARVAKRLGSKPAGGGTSKPSTSKPKIPAFPGRSKFGIGKNNASVTALGRQLVKKGYGSHYTKGPGPRWTEADRLNVEAFQRAQGWRGSDADGYPGPETWRRLFS